MTLFTVTILKRNHMKKKLLLTIALLSGGIG
jgi:hypothetical protein